MNKRNSYTRGLKIWPCIDRVTLCLIISMGLVAQTGLAFAQTKATSGLSTFTRVTQLADRGGDDPTSGEQWFYKQRAAIGGTIPQNAYYASLQQADQLQHQGAQNLQNQQLAPSQAPFGKWANLGPAPIQSETTLSTSPSNDSGRVTNVQLGFGNALYIGSAGGGVWKSTDSGQSWNALTNGYLSNGDPIPSLAIGALTVLPGTSAGSDTIFVGTGEDVPAIDAMYGQGILLSTDSGQNWSTLGDSQTVFAGYGIRQITVDQSLNPNSNAYGTIFVASNKGLYESQDDGQTFTSVTIDTNDPAAITAVDVITVVPGTSGQTLYAVVPATGAASTDTAGIAGLWMSTDGGNSWQHVTSSGLPSGVDFDNTAMALASSNPNVMYLAISTAASTAYGDLTGLYLSQDGGSTWQQVQGVPNYFGQAYYYGSGSGAQGWYDNAIAVSPSDPYNVTVGGIALVQLEVAQQNGQPTATQVQDLASALNIHPDQHGLIYDSSGKLFIGNDGGMWEITAAGIVQDLNTNLSLTQFYPGISEHAQGQVILAGSQDNGTVSGDVYQGDPWTELEGGDGTYTAINPVNQNIVYGEFPQGQIYEVDRATGQAFLTTPPTTVGGQWVAPFVLDPQNPAVMYAGEEDVYMSSDGGQTWSQMSNVYGQSNGGYGQISALAIAPSDPNVLYAAWSNAVVNAQGQPQAVSLIEMSTDGGMTWQEIGTFNDWVASLTVDPSNPDALYETMSGYYPLTSNADPHVEYNANTLTAAAHANTGYGWTDITGNLPDAPVNKLVVDGSYLVAATDTGVYSSLVSNIGAGSQVWSAVGSGLPTVPVVDLTLMGDGELLAATHGLGLWTVAPLHLTQVASLSQNFGAAAGGEWITVNGSGFDGATAVTFKDLQDSGSSIAATNFQVINNNVIEVQVPADTAAATNPETVDVQVAGPYGTSPATPVDEFTYGAQFTIATGGTAMAGQTVKIAGTLADLAGNGRAGQQVIIGLLAGGQVTSPQTVTTDVYGDYSAALTMPTTPQTIEVAASTGSTLYADGLLQVDAAAPNHMTLSPVTATTLNVGGLTLLSGVVQDVYHNPVPDASVLFTVDGPGNQPNGTIMPAVTDAAGQFSAYFLGTAPGQATVTSYVYNTAAQASAMLVVSDLDVNHIPAQIAFTQATATAQVGATVTLQGIVKDASGQPVAHALLNVSALGATAPKSVTTDAAGAFQITFTAPDSAGVVSVSASAVAAGQTVVGTAQVQVYEEPALGNATLPSGWVGSLYSASLPDSGGLAPLIWSVSSGQLPKGLALTDGVISGTPMTAGVSTFTVTVTDANGTTAAQTYSITVSPSVAPAITTTTLPTATPGSLYVAMLLEQGGIAPLTWSATGLPPGLTLQNGIISGTTSTAGSFTVKVTVTDSSGATSTKTLTLLVQSSSNGGSSGGTTGGTIGGTIGGAGGVTTGVAGSQLPTTVLSQSVSNAGATLVQKASGSMVTVSVPTGAFSTNETVTVTTATVATETSLLASLPSGQSGVVLFGVSYSGAAPTKPITLTITNASIQPGETVYKAGANGQLIPVQATVIAGEATISFTSDPDFVVAAPSKPALPKLTAGQRAVEWGFKEQVVPAFVGRDPKTKVFTTYMPIWYVMRTLNDFGITSTWNGKVWDLQSLSGQFVPVDPISTSGAMIIQINGKTVIQVLGEARTDPISGKVTTFMPIWYVMQAIKQLHVASTWNGKAWGLSQQS